MTDQKRIKVIRYRSPVGEMIVGSFEDKICLCDWAQTRQRAVIDRRICRKLNAEYEAGTSEVIRRAIAQLDEYFRGERREFTIPLVFTGSEFQNLVWQELLNIPYAETISYAEQARRIGKPRAVRAVAAANATNPISILVPCHRVIGSNHKLTGYGGGLDAKQRLIELERERFLLTQMTESPINMGWNGISDTSEFAKLQYLVPCLRPELSHASTCGRASLVQK